MNLDRLSALAAAIGKGLVAFADSLAQATPAPVPAAPPPPPAPSPPPAQPPAPDTAPVNPVAAAVLSRLKADLVAINSAPERKRRKRTPRVPLRHRPDGPGCDYVDEDGTQFLSQRGVGERLHISVAHVAALEAQGRLVRHMVCGGKIGYRCDDIERIAAMVEASKAKQATPSAPPTTEPNASRA